SSNRTSTGCDDACESLGCPSIRTGDGSSHGTRGRGSSPALSLVYINRFSDWLFILGRWVSLQLNHDESLWVPLGQRPAEQGVARRVRLMRSNDDDFTDL
ncbi:MAG: hypothetical protein L7U25_01540, partial [Candidatus Poseidonia sp.]|nr:hypothetical protein [Poseidonia sp.]